MLIIIRLVSPVDSRSFWAWGAFDCNDLSTPRRFQLSGSFESANIHALLVCLSSLVQHPHGRAQVSQKACTFTQHSKHSETWNAQKFHMNDHDSRQYEDWFPSGVRELGIPFQGGEATIYVLRIQDFFIVLRIDNSSKGVEDLVGEI